MINIANGARLPHVWNDTFIDALRGLGELELVENGMNLSDDEAARKLSEYAYISRKNPLITFALSYWGD